MGVCGGWSGGWVGGCFQLLYTVQNASLSFDSRPSELKQLAKLF